ncbi:MAG: hypothetical protein IKG92_00895 [Bacteroidales bacterium]|nr:hypothetical protein [Bacteroidales bacterium]
MKKFLSLITLVLLFSCAKEADVPVQLEQPVQEALTYTLSVPAGKDTKALNIDGTALKATWAEGETVRVFRGELLLGTLTAQTAGQSTTLTGEIKGEIKDDDKFTLRFLSPSYASQDGTLNYIATHCDYAVANVTVSKIVGSAVTTTQASFQNQQAIVKFDLRNADNTADISASALMITLPDQVIRVTPASAQSEFYVAVPALSSQSISLKALVEDEVFMLNKSGVSLSAGSYYNITAILSKTGIVVVHNESELTTAVKINDAQILFANDIAIANLLEIKDSKTVTIDMDGFTLNRGCTSRGSQAIVVRNGSTLNLSSGTVTGGWGGNGGALDIETNTTVNLNNVMISDNHADDRGGGISNKGTLAMTGGAITNNTSHDHEWPRGGGGLFNYGGATATLTNVTFNGNGATVTGGGGICNYGTLTLDSCTITGNSCMMNGGGIWQGADATLNLQGKTTVIDNTSDGNLPSDFFLKTNAVITVTGSLSGSSIGVQMENNTGTFTSGFGTHNSGVDPAILFFSNLPEAYQVAAAESEAKVDVLTTLHYIACSWDDVNKQVVKTQKTLSNCIPLGSIPESEADYKVITGGSGEFGMGGMTGSYPEFFVVRGTVNRDAIRVNGTDVHLVLCDGATLNVNSIIVNPAYKLYIHVQSYGPSMGKLHADNNGHQETAAGIGSESGLSHAPNLDGPGLIEIHGGTIYAKGGDNGAGIGGGDWAKGGNIVIYGGDIRAYGGDGGGIDGSAGAGIGGGNLAEGPINFTVYGGTVYAYGGPDAAGIGSGNCGNNFDYTIHHGGYFTMYGGYVEAHGADNGAGIGGGEYSEGPKGVNIYGGTVKAYGGDDAAGIGGGYHWAKELSSGTIHISGGEVYAWGKSEGAGIGGGENGKGADVTITGGIVEAHAGENELYYKAIGPGRDNDNYGTLELGDNVMVRYKIGSNWSDPVPVSAGRKNGAWYHTEARIEPCTHPGYTAETCPYHVHP